jgi:hypothetical protein
VLLHVPGPAVHCHPGIAQDAPDRAAAGMHAGAHPAVLAARAILPAHAARARRCRAPEDGTRNFDAIFLTDPIYCIFYMYVFILLYYEIFPFMYQY